MATKNQELQRWIRQFRIETGATEVDMLEVAKYAHQRGWPLPQPSDPLNRLAQEFARAAREETRTDSVTGQPYRVNHAVPMGQLTLWIDIDEAPRKPMLRSLTNRREQMVGDGLQLTFDADHWNRIHPNEEPIQIELDFGPDIEWRKNGAAIRVG